MKKINKVGLFALTALTSAMAGAAEPIGHEITYAGEISRIMQDNCQICHQPGQIGPMSFTSYEEVRPWAPLISMLVKERAMPPYQYDLDVGVQHLRDDWRMSDEDINTVVAWVNAGSPFGDPADLPEPKQFPAIGEWRLAAELGQPDHVIKSAKWDVPATGQDLWWEPEVDSGITESRCIKAVETLPSAAAHGSTHHANSHFLVKNEQGEWVSGSRLSEFAFGKLGEKVPDGACRKVPVDSKVKWSIHYYPDGTAVPDDQVSVGIWYYDETDDFDEATAYPQDLRLYVLDGGGDYLIPPHGKLITQGMHSFDHPVRLDSWQPHLHLRGVAMSMEVFDPTTRRREVLSQVSNWSAGWNHSHTYEDGYQPLIPAGATIILNAWFDNSAANPHNPDPDQWVGAGQRTTDEMSHAWIAVTHLDDEGYQKLIKERAERDQRTVSSTGAGQ
jgi:mono/diheme cytochrome c family protein